MAEVLRSGFDLRSRLGGIFRPKCVAFFLALGSSLLIQPICAYAQAPAPSQAKKGSQPASNPTAPEPAPPPPAQIWLPPLQNPEHTPEISWDGQLLTIDAENSSLADIMIGIRSRTGASIEMPGSANRERVAVHLGPAPIRDVLSALLYGTDFNYVIQSSEDDDTALGEVILIGRDGDASDDVVADDTHPKSKIRLMPGYAAPGKRDYEVAHRKAMDDAASTVAEAPADSSAQSSDQPDADSAAANSQPDAPPVASNSESTDPSPSPESNALTAADQAFTTGTTGAIAGNGSTSTSSPSGGSTISQMEQNLQKMYQQRQQLQAQQNRPVQPPTSTP